MYLISNKTKFCKNGHDKLIVGIAPPYNCKECVRIRVARNAKRNSDFIKWIGNIKMKSGCKDCGYNKYPEALDFDHIGDKIASITDMIYRGYAIDKIFEEMDKCEIVCANCHRHRTLERTRMLSKSH